MPSWRLIVIALAHKSGGNNTDLALRVAAEHFTAGNYVNYLTDSAWLESAIV